MYLLVAVTALLGLMTRGYVSYRLFGPHMFSISILAVRVYFRVRRRFGTLPADWAPTLRNRWFADSALERTGFGPSVTRKIGHFFETVLFASAPVSVPPERPPRFARGDGRV